MPFLQICPLALLNVLLFRCNLSNLNDVNIAFKTVFRCAPDLADRAKENPKSVTEAEWRQLLSGVQYQVGWALLMLWWKKKATTVLGEQGKDGRGEFEIRGRTGRTGKKRRYVTRKGRELRSWSKRPEFLFPILTSIKNII